MANPFLIPFLLTLTAGISTVLGSFIYFAFRKFSNTSLNFSLELSAGVMLYISFIELVPESTANIGFLMGNVFFFIGIIVMASIDLLIPHAQFIPARCENNVDLKKIYSAGFMTALGLALHNFPEGIAVFMSSYANIELGLVLTIAITLHNIPEGIAITAPIYYSTKNKTTAFMYTLLAGLVEPIGGLLTFLVLRPFLSDFLLYAIYALVAGIMVYISFDELLPICLKHERKLVPILGITMGMIITAVSLWLIW